MAITLKRLRRFTGNLARVRVKYRAADEKLKMMMAKFEKKHAKLIKEVIELKKEEHLADGVLRNLALQAYDESGNRNPAPGLTIRDHQTVEYGHDDTVLDWCLKHKLFIKVDQVALRKFVLAFSDYVPTPVAWVNDENPTVAIASSLNVE